MVFHVFHMECIRLKCHKHVNLEAVDGFLVCIAHIWLLTWRKRVVDQTVSPFYMKRDACLRSDSEIETAVWMRNVKFNDGRTWNVNNLFFHCVHVKYELLCEEYGEGVKGERLLKWLLFYFLSVIFIHVNTWSEHGPWRLSFPTKLNLWFQQVRPYSNRTLKGTVLSVMLMKKITLDEFWPCDADMSDKSTNAMS